MSMLWLRGRAAASEAFLDANTAMALNTRLNSTRLITLMDSAATRATERFPPSRARGSYTDRYLLDRTFMVDV